MADLPTGHERVSQPQRGQRAGKEGPEFSPQGSTGQHIPRQNKLGNHQDSRLGRGEVRAELGNDVTLPIKVAKSGGGK